MIRIVCFHLNLRCFVFKYFVLTKVTLVHIGHIVLVVKNTPKNSPKNTPLAPLFELRGDYNFSILRR